jgi:hypothetical protein
MGHLIPAGTGFETNRKIEITQVGDAFGADKKESQKAAS